MERSEQHIYQFVLFVHQTLLIHTDIFQEITGLIKKKKEEILFVNNQNIFFLCQIFQAHSETKTTSMSGGKEQG